MSLVSGIQWSVSSIQCRKSYGLDLYSFANLKTELFRSVLYFAELIQIKARCVFLNLSAVGPLPPVLISRYDKNHSPDDFWRSDTGHWPLDTGYLTTGHFPALFRVFLPINHQPVKVRSVIGRVPFFAGVFEALLVLNGDFEH